MIYSILAKLKLKRKRTFLYYTDNTPIQTIESNMSMFSIQLRDRQDILHDCSIVTYRSNFIYFTTWASLDERTFVIINKKEYNLHEIRYYLR